MREEDADAPSSMKTLIPVGLLVLACFPSTGEGKGAMVERMPAFLAGYVQGCLRRRASEASFLQAANTALANKMLKVTNPSLEGSTVKGDKGISGRIMMISVPDGRGLLKGFPQRCRGGERGQG